VKDDRLYIEHVLECVDRILDYCREGEAAFLRSELIQDAVLPLEPRAEDRTP
jgi:uncharacterized protein with HEPN domain